MSRRRVEQEARSARTGKGIQKMRRSRSLVLEALEDKVLLTAATTPIVPAPLPTISPVTQGLVEKLSTNHQVYRRGEPVVITLSETNTSQQAISVEEGPSIGGFYVSHDARKIWASNTGPQPMFVMLKTLEPGQSITQSVTWNGQTNVGSASSATGNFTIGSQLAGVQSVGIRIVR